MLGVYRLGVPHNFGIAWAYDAVLVLVLGVLAVSRCGDAWSLDRRFAASRNETTNPFVEPSGEYRWPVRAVWLILSLVFFSAGFSKLSHGGIAWILSDNLAIVLAQSAYHIANEDPVTRWGLWVAQSPALCSLLAFATVVVETGYPLALFSRPARWFFPPVMCATLVGFRLLMGPTFPQFFVCHLFWVPWDHVVHRLRSRFVSSQALGEPSVLA